MVFITRFSFKLRAFWRRGSGSGKRLKLLAAEYIKKVESGELIASKSTTPTIHFRTRRRIDSSGVINTILSSYEGPSEENFGYEDFSQHSESLIIAR